MRVAPSGADGAVARDRSSSHGKRAGAGSGAARKKTTSTSSLQEEEQAGAPATLDRAEYEETLTDAGAVAGAQQLQQQQPNNHSPGQRAAAAAAAGRGEADAAGAGSSLLDDLDAVGGGEGGSGHGLLDIDEFLGSSGASVPASDANPLLRNVLLASSSSASTPDQFAAYRLLAENSDLRMVYSFRILIHSLCILESYSICKPNHYCIQCE